MLSTVPDGKRIFIEIKCGPEILPVLKKQLAASGLLTDQVVIICFLKAVITESRRLMPNYKANWLCSYEQETKQSDWKPTNTEVLRSLKSTGATGLGTHANLNVIDQDFVEAVRGAGFEFHVWTVNDAKTAEIFQELEVDSVTTDRPAYIRNLRRANVAVGATE